MKFLDFIEIPLIIFICCTILLIAIFNRKQNVQNFRFF